MEIFATLLSNKSVFMLAPPLPWKKLSTVKVVLSSQPIRLVRFYGQSNFQPEVTIGADWKVCNLWGLELLTTFDLVWSGLALALTQILMVGPTAAHSQYLLGLKHRAFKTAPPSSVYKCFPSFKSHSIAWPSLPPDAHREPSGETVTQFRYPVWPMWLVFRRQFVRFHTCQVTYNNNASAKLSNWRVGT